MEGRVGGYVSRWAPHLQLPNRVTVMDYRLERSRGSGSVFDSVADLVEEEEEEDQFKGRRVDKKSRHRSE